MKCNHKALERAAYTLRMNRHCEITCGVCGGKWKIELKQDSPLRVWTSSGPWE